jgi:PAS domain S-box-containing protein
MHIKEEQGNTASDNFLLGGSEMSQAISKYDWSATALGPIASWPQSLKTTLGIILNSPFPMFLYWGPDLMCFYNDKSHQLFNSASGDSVTTTLGKPASTTFPQIWSATEPLIHHIMAGNNASRTVNAVIPMQQNTGVKEVEWTFGCNPVYDELGKIEGIFMSCHENISIKTNTSEISPREKYFQDLIGDASFGSVIVVGDEMRISLINKTFARLLGHTPDTLIGKPLFAVVPELEATYRPIIDETLLTGKPIHLFDLPYSFLANGIKKEGYLNIIFQPYKENDNNIGAMISCNDATAQKKMRQESEENAKRFRALIENAPVATCLFTGKDMVIEVVNEMMLKYWGKDESVIGKPILEALPELEGQIFIPILNGIYTTGETFASKDAETKLMIDGELKTFYFDFTFKPLYDAEGNFYGILDMAIDVTEEILAKKSLQQSESKFRSLVLKAPVGICIVKGDPVKVEVVNDKFLELVGRTRKQFNENNYWEVLKELEHIYAPILNNVMQTGQSYTGKEHEINLIRNDREETIFVDFVYEAVKNKDGSLASVMILAIEITDQVLARKKSEEAEILIRNRAEDLTKQVQQRTLELQRSNDDLLKFAHVASHDLKEPVRKIRIFSSRLEQEFGALLPPPAITYVNKIQNAADRMKIMIDGVLTYSTLNGSEKEIETIDLNDTIGGIEADLEVVIAQKAAVIQKENLPVIEGASVLIYQLFYNLVNNALKFSQENRPPVITISAAIEHKNDNDYAVIQVEDNGIGFDNEYIDTIFDAFTRLNSKDKYEGTGLGLALCKKIVERHHGDIAASGILNKGAVFTIHLPIKQLKKHI